MQQRQKPIYIQKVGWQQENRLVRAALAGLNEREIVEGRILGDEKTLGVATYLQSIVTRLTNAQPEIFGQKNISVLISDAPVSFAHVEHKKSGHLIVINKRMFSLLKTEDEMASVVAHEMAHTLFDKDKIEYTTAEEVSADLIGSELLSRAGYHWQDGAVALKSIQTYTRQYKQRGNASNAYLSSLAYDENRTEEAQQQIYEMLEDRLYRVAVMMDDVEESASQVHATLSQRIKYLEQTLPGAYLIMRGESLESAESSTAFPPDATAQGISSYTNPFIVPISGDPVQMYQKFCSVLNAENAVTAPYQHAEACEFYFERLKSVVTR